MFISWTDTSQDVYMEEKEVGEFEPKTDETFLVQQKPVSRAKLEARTDSVQVQHLSSSLLMYCQPSFNICVWWSIQSDLALSTVAPFYNHISMFFFSQLNVSATYRDVQSWCQFASQHWKIPSGNTSGISEKYFRFTSTKTSVVKSLSCFVRQQKLQSYLNLNLTELLFRIF